MGEGFSWCYGLILVDVEEFEGETEEIHCLVEVITNDGDDHPIGFLESSIQNLKELEQAYQDVKAAGTNRWFYDNGTFEWTMNEDLERKAWAWTPHTDETEYAKFDVRLPASDRAYCPVEGEEVLMAIVEHPSHGTLARHGDRYIEVIAVCPTTGASIPVWVPRALAPEAEAVWMDNSTGYMCLQCERVFGPCSYGYPPTCDHRGGV
jgi:hypothetical protein